MSTYSIVIAEDEKLIRTGIADSIAWDSLHAEVAGLAKNGKEAYDIIINKKIDILITDIQMAGGDGLGLIRDVNRINPEIKVIIISGYNNFSYAQQAIQLGVKDYILKPINIDELYSIISQLIKKIDDERRNKNNFDRFSAFYNEHRQTLLNDFFRDLLFGTLSDVEIKQGIALHDYNKSHLMHIPVVLYSEIRMPMESSSLQQLLQESLSNCFNKHNISLESLFFFPNEIFYTDIALVFSVSKSSLAILDFINDIKAVISSLSEFSLLGIGVGELCSSLRDLSFSYRKARTHAMFSMISGFNIRQKHHEGNSELLPLPLHETTMQLYNLLSQIDQRPLKEYLKSLEKEIKSENRTIEYKQRLLRNVLICVLSAGDELGVPVRKFFSDLMTLYRYSNLKSVEELFTKISWACRTIINQYATLEDHSGINLMEKARIYIQSHFDDPLLSINLVAEYLGLTPAYFSRLCKKSYGMTYIDYITKLRMEKAEKILKENPSIKISAVATNVGYNSPSYFNYVFKKYFGKTPKEYQKEKCVD